MDWWRGQTGADMVRVPFKGGGDSVTGMLSGTTPVAFFGIGNWLPHVAAGTVRPLAVDGEHALAARAGRADASANSATPPTMTRTYFGIVAPPGTPQPIVAQLYEQIAAIGRDPEFRRKRLVEVGLEPVFDTPGGVRPLPQGGPGAGRGDRSGPRGWRRSRCGQFDLGANRRFAAMQRKCRGSIESGTHPPRPRARSA